jgi:hypothetical protein
MRWSADDLERHGQVETAYGPGLRGTEGIGAEALRWGADEIERLRVALKEYKAVDAEYHQQIRLNNERMRTAMLDCSGTCSDHYDIISKSEKAPAS